MSLSQTADNEYPYSEQSADAFKLVESRLVEIEETLAFIKEHIVKATTTIDTVSVEVMPTINAIMESPMVKVLGMGGKKK